MALETTPANHDCEEKVKNQLEFFSFFRGYLSFKLKQILSEQPVIIFVAINCSFK